MGSSHGELSGESIFDLPDSIEDALCSLPERERLKQSSEVPSPIPWGTPFTHTPLNLATSAGVFHDTVQPTRAVVYEATPAAGLDVLHPLAVIHSLPLGVVLAADAVAFAVLEAANILRAIDLREAAVPAWNREIEAAFVAGACCASSSRMPAPPIPSSKLRVPSPCGSLLKKPPAYAFPEA